MTSRRVFGWKASLKLIFFFREFWFASKGDGFLEMLQSHLPLLIKKQEFDIFWLQFTVMAFLNFHKKK